MSAQTYEHSDGDSGLEIAIVGMAGRFPGADDVDALWRNVRDGVESVAHHSDEALRARGVPQAALDDPAFVKAGVPFDGADRFDAAFFGYNPREAEQLDPQQRILLECAWHALEHAGYDAQRLACPVGVYAGAGANLYLLRHLLPRHGLDAGVAELIGLMNGNSPDSLSTRVAYKLDLRGPAVTVQTACSTSLAAVHMACQALLAHECDMALAGGVWLNLLQDHGYRHQPGAILSSDGHCRAFDAAADGTVLGSGAGIVVLKRLDEALRAGDTIHAVIKGSAANNDGAAKVGYTAPSVEGQAAAIRAAHTIAGVAPDSIGYVEAHGTGTTLGDPIEIAALTQAFRAGTAARGFCAIGSLKTNIGHLDAAAGVAGLIKTVQALRHRTLPPSLNFTAPNPRIDFPASPFYVNTEAKPWPAGAAPRRAGVSSFGMGGTNVHVVLEEAPAATRSATATRGAQLLRLSARSESALRAQAQQLAARLQAGLALDNLALDDIAHTLRQGRARFDHRAVVVARDPVQAAQALSAQAAPQWAAGKRLARAPSVAFLFPGQGAQHVGMARTLYDEAPVFRQTVDHCCAALAPHLGLDLRTLIWPQPGSEADAAAQLAQTAFTQPALFVIEYALAQLWVHHGIRPEAMLGHSVGEYVAACVAGVFALDDALALVALRGRLMQSTRPGAMLAVTLPPAELAAWLDAGCDLAAVNADDLCVLSGTPEAIAQAERELAARGVAVRRLHVSHAFHSALMQPILGEFETAVRHLTLRAPAIPFVSNLSGTWITPEQACSPDYWVRHLRGTVRFTGGLDTLLQAPGRIALEVGPGDTLSGLARRHPLAASRPVLASQAHPSRQDLQADQFLRCLGQLWIAGVEAEAEADVDGKDVPQGRRMPLPGYPFERQSYWVEAGAARLVHDAPVPGDMLHVPEWHCADLPACVPANVPADAATATGCTLILGDSNLAWLVAAQLAQPVAAVTPGAAFARHDDRHYTARPDDRADLLEVLRHVTATQGPVTRICHLWSVGTDDAARGFDSLLALAQALDALPGERAITVVTDGVEDVTGTEPLAPRKAALRGPCLTLAQELPGTTCRLIDIVPPVGGDAARVAMQLCAHLQSADPATPVALRGPRRWVRRWIRHAEAAAVQAPAQSRLRRQGVYLITGGLGGIGLTLARHLAEHWQARLVLVGRTAMPARADWSRLADDTTQPADLRARLAALLALEDFGAQVLTVCADVAEAAQLHAALEAARERFGALHGVIHAAGAAGGTLITAQDAASARRVFAAKVRGAEHLLDQLAEASPDFVLFCSSLSAVAGGLGMAAYAGANACLDALAAASQRRLHWPVLSVGWDGWRGVGMAAGMAWPEGLGLTPEDGAAAFARIVEGPARPHTLVVSTDLASRLRGLDGIALPEDEATPAAALHPRPDLATAYVAPADDLATALATIWGELLGIDAIGIHDNLFELGGDSLLGIRLLARVRQAFGVEIHAAAFLREPTIDALALLIESRLIDEIEAGGSVLAS